MCLSRTVMFCVIGMARFMHQKHCMQEGLSALV